MLYQRWLHLSAAHATQLALLEADSGRSWSFAQLAAEAEAAPADNPGWVHPTGMKAGFILEVLRAWRDGQVVCPLEPGQHSPALAALPEQIIHLKITSATSGMPRVIAFTAAQLAADAANIVATMGLRPEWPNLGVISLAHSYGFSNLVLPLLLHGIPLILVSSPLPEALRQATALVPDLTLPAVPALWRAWHEAGAIPHNVRLAISAGAPLPLALETAVFECTGLKLHNFYGSSECGGIAYDASASPRTDASYAGTALRNVRLSQSPDGCLEVRSAAVGETYLPEPDAKLRGGCFQTSDLVELRGEAVWLRGRLSDQINIAGRKLSPEAVERALLAHPRVRECLVFGAPASRAERSEIIVACVTVQAPVSSEELKQFLLGQLPAWQVPREWRFLPELPANQRGKLSRAWWREKYLAERQLAEGA